MLDAAEAEFFGEHEGKEGTAFPAAAAESKPAASSQRQPYFKSSPLASPAMEASAQACAAVAVAGAAQSKPASERAAVGVFKPTRSEGKRWQFFRGAEYVLSGHGCAVVQPMYSSQLCWQCSCVLCMSRRRSVLSFSRYPPAVQP